MIRSPYGIAQWDLLQLLCLAHNFYYVLAFWRTCVVGKLMETNLFLESLRMADFVVTVLP